MATTKSIQEMSSDEIKQEVKKAYAKVAQRKSEPEQSSGCCGPGTTSGCGTGSSAGCGPNSSSNLALNMGYDIENLPASATDSFAGCGNPVALASLKKGEVVLDLGSGAGLDVIMAARQVGNEGRVIGVDMTPEMLQKARENIEKLGLTNVEFRQGDIEDLPVENDTIDVIISNCVINLAPDKAKVFEESFRVLKPSGRLMVSDIVLNNELPPERRAEVATYTGCVGGAVLEKEYLQYIRNAGFEDVKVESKADFGYAASAKISAIKPKE
ncbi:MAG: arsenite methyltransferase [Candidatus Thorarchaeota archaeon]